MPIDWRVDLLCIAASLDLSSLWRILRLLLFALAPHHTRTSTQKSNSAEHHAESEADTVNHFVEEAMELLDLEKGLRTSIKTADRKLTVELRVPLDNGELFLSLHHQFCARHTYHI